ncbi:spore coat protein [Methanoculleus taiwanensis]|uniref:Spore coat protein n=1 Tax=Methanoculleus taiwanensis TaxID=1550565 RepID=A0A498GWE5_9EURY|nr:UDP-4-amino-4,6-dideoxy-N-acetyl-beta-L-altrosamine transaminase [Methanoculleus taiwanensis]RXE55082.1 spore coat protein [Methanoculleus taiwanensis]
MIPYGKQDITEVDIDAVVEVLRSDFITQGPAVPRFEQAVAARVQAKHAVAVNSATSALHIACLALGLGREDRLWTVPNTFVASANCGRYCGADVDFVDIDPLTWNMSLPRLREKLRQARRDGRLPKVLVPVHFAGQPTEQEEIRELAEEYGFRVLEDASHAIGADRNGEPVGSCRWSDITVFSFHPVKIITTGEGGMALTNDDDLARRMALLRTHGITRDTDLLQASAPAPWYYEQQMLGFNYRMTDIQAALGFSQLTRLDAYITRRNALAERYNESLQDLPLELPTVLSGNRSAYHLYVVRLKQDMINKTHRQVFEDLRSQGIGVNLHYMPVHLQPYYRKLGFTEGSYPEAERHGQEAITLPLYPGLTEHDQNLVVKALQEALSGE